MAFAFTLTRAGHEVSDAQVAELIDRYGEKQVVAMVLFLAYANFQDCCLPQDAQIESEPGGPLPPLDVRFARVGPEASSRLFAPEAAHDPRRSRSARTSGAH